MENNPHIPSSDIATPVESMPEIYNPYSLETFNKMGEYKYPETDDSTKDTDLIELGPYKFVVKGAFYKG